MTDTSNIYIYWAIINLTKQKMKQEKFEELYVEFDKNIKFIKCPIHGAKITAAIGES